MEKCIYSGNYKNIFDNEYNRIYFGEEFCEKLIVSKKDIEKYIKSYGDKYKLTFMTPYVTNYGIKEIKGILEILNNINNIEVIFNDWGVFNILKTFKNIKPILGRLFSREFRDPRKTCNIPIVPKINSQFVKHLIDEGINRIELDTDVNEFDINEDLLNNVSFSIYYPFTFITTSRYCLTQNFVANDNIRSVRECKYECNKMLYSLKHNSLKTPIILKGNTFYFGRGVNMKNIHKNINRIVQFGQ